MAAVVRSPVGKWDANGGLRPNFIVRRFKHQDWLYGDVGDKRNGTEENQGGT
jgi:hypothetical protein